MQEAWAIVREKNYGDDLGDQWEIEEIVGPFASHDAANAFAENHPERFKRTTTGTEQDPLVVETWTVYQLATS